MSQINFYSVFHQAETIYASRGFAVFPLIEGRKEPAIKGGFLEATTDLDLIGMRRRVNPSGNIGIATGTISQLFVLDVDNKAVDGFQSLAALEDEYGELPLTVVQETPSGGRHYFFRPRIALPSTIGLRPGIDTRGEKGYIVAAPSKLSNGSYRYASGAHLRGVPIAHVPDWLEELVLKTRAPKASPGAQDPHNWRLLFDMGAQEGGRREAVVRLSGHLLRRYVDPYLTLEIIRLWNSRNRPPLDDAEITKAVEGIARREAARRASSGGAA